MTRITPAQFNARLVPVPSATPSSAPTMDHAASHAAQARSKHFMLADMEGRSPDRNRACAGCIAMLSPVEAAQVTPHVDERNPCRLCQVAAQDPGAYTQPFCDFLHENPTVFHTIDYFKKKLNLAGYTELPARDSWTDKIVPGGKHFLTRNGSSIIAFAVGKSYKPGNGISMICGHVDSITASLKPVSKKPNKAGYVELGVAPYAGGLNETWWDRDLCIGGRVVVTDPDTGKTTIRLVQSQWPIARIPTLAVHFGQPIMGFKNKETQAVPIIGLETPADSDAEPIAAPGSFVNDQPPRLVKLIADELGIKALETISYWELQLFDSQPAATMGLDREFITAGRMDDKACSWAALMALLASQDRDDDGSIRLLGCFDDEEIGSLLRQGARSNFLPSTIERLLEALSPASHGPGLFGQTMARSFLLSADVSHATNPNFLEHYLPEHTPKLNVGLVLASDSNGHMTTDAVSASILRRIAQMSGCTLQNFDIRNDSHSGGTIGPMLSSMLGVRSVDAGIPEMSMHSIRAMTGSLDPGLAVKIFTGLYDNWEAINQEWE